MKFKYKCVCVFTTTRNFLADDEKKFMHLTIIHFITISSLSVHLANEPINELYSINVFTKFKLTFEKMYSMSLYISERETKRQVIYRMSQYS